MTQNIDSETDKPQQSTNTPEVNSNIDQSLSDSAFTSDEALAQFVQDPIHFIRQIIAEEAVKHLARLKEEAELRGTVNIFRKKYPDFVRFEPLILQEVAMLIQNDPDGNIDPWDKLLEKAMGVFKQKFRAMMEDGGLHNVEKPALNSADPPFIEGGRNRKLPEQSPTFTRAQIANMSLDEFLKNETAIDDAMKNKRII